MPSAVVSLLNLHENVQCRVSSSSVTHYCFRGSSKPPKMPDLPKAFAVPTAYGDLTAASLALLALWPVRSERAVAIPMVWLFNIVGTLDLIYANISSIKDHVDPTYLGVSYYLAVLSVPAMLVVHVLIFAYLLRRSPAN